jgi:hypothetical protein
VARIAGIAGWVKQLVGRPTIFIVASLAASAFDNPAFAFAVDIASTAAFPVVASFITAFPVVASSKVACLIAASYSAGTTFED